MSCMCRYPSWKSEFAAVQVHAEPLDSWACNAGTRHTIVAALLCGRQPLPSDDTPAAGARLALLCLPDSSRLPANLTSCHLLQAAVLHLFVVAHEQAAGGQAVVPAAGRRARQQKTGHPVSPQSTCLCCLPALPAAAAQRCCHVHAGRRCDELAARTHAGLQVLAPTHCHFSVCACMCSEVNRGGLAGLYRILLEDSGPWFAAALRHISSKCQLPPLHS